MIWDKYDVKYGGDDGDDDDDDDGDDDDYHDHDEGKNKGKEEKHQIGILLAEILLDDSDKCWRAVASTACPVAFFSMPGRLNDVCLLFNPKGSQLEYVEHILPNGCMAKIW